MPPKKSLQAQLDEHNEEFRRMMAEMQQNFQANLSVVVAAAVQTVLQAQRGVQGIQNTLLQFNPITLSEAHQRALLIEQSARNQNTSSNPSRNRLSSATDTGTSQPLDQVRISEIPENTTTMGQQRSANFKCFKCGDQGHRQSACPNPARRGLMAKDEPVQC
ncbi:unnamed protein product [Arabidopsis thaliana]|uniref:(thale cress) hypothetical protein n=1 Tax=Arabidopsis thaliana TaxID=3702 RepID=A0A7G2EVI4_ARATH|nr:unnamed protein product [Arabidopsis thaliana]